MSAFVFVMHVGNVRLAASESARARGDVGTAVRTARQAEQWQPWSSQPPLLLGKSQLAAGDLDGAAASFRTAIRRDPGDWEGWYQLGLATSGRERAAAFDRASRLDPIDSSFAAPAKRT